MGLSTNDKSMNTSLFEFLIKVKDEMGDTGIELLMIRIGNLAIETIKHNPSGGVDEKIYRLAKYGLEKALEELALIEELEK